MKVYLGQIYVVPGVEFPFSTRFQQWLGEEITRRLESSERFVSSFGPHHDVMFRISARENIARPVVEGPRVYTKDREVEWTVFLPYDGSAGRGLEQCSAALGLLLEACAEALSAAGVDASRLLADRELLMKAFESDPTMMKRKA